MENKIHNKEPQVEELFRRIQKLEDGHARLKQEMMELKINRKKSDRKTSNGYNDHGGAARDGGGTAQHSAGKLTEAQCFNILQTIDQPIHVTNSRGRIIYRNRAWENFYGYNAAETVGKSLIELVIEPNDFYIANDILQHMLKGKSWSGEFPVRNKRGERFVIFGSNKPFYDENGTIIGTICVSTAPCKYHEKRPSVGAPRRLAREKHGLHPQLPLQTAFASKIYD